MGFLDRLLGNDRTAPPRRESGPARVLSDDEQALERYRYMMRTAPPETIEQAHREAFARLTAEQRQQVLKELAKSAPPNERAAVEATSTSDPNAMARVATRAEIREPGAMERTLGGAGAGMGLAGSLLTSFAAGFVGSMVAQSFFSALGGWGADDAHSGSEDATAANDEHGGHDDSADDGGFDDGGFGDGGDFEV